jgi:AcrR family transcriptional regulator
LNASGISKGAFYHYFKSKDEVLAASIDNLLDEAVAFLLPTVEDPNLGAMDKFNKFMEKKSKFQTAKMEYATLLGKLMNSGVFQQKYMFAMSHKMVPLFAEIIQQGKDEGIFQIEYPYETADILIRSIVGVPNSYAYKEYMSDDEKRKRYLLSLRGIIAGALGIEKHGFSL